MKLNDKIIDRFARGRVKVGQYFRIADAIAQDPLAQDKLRHELDAIADPDEQKRVREVHEALGEYNQRCHAVVRELFGVDVFYRRK